MNTYVDNLQNIIPLSVDKEKIVNNKKLEKDKDQAVSEKFIPVPLARMEEGDLPVWRVHFEALKATSPINICLEINGDIILGVEDSTNEVINLSCYSDSIVGVSRRHLQVLPTKTDLLITDLNSTNGTRINGRLVQPNHPYNIYNGDVLEIGNLTLAVNILKTPTERLILTRDTSNIVDALTHISTVITSNLDPDDVLDRILKTALNLCEADEIALLLWDRQTHELYLRAERGIGDNKTRLMKVPVKQEYSVSEVLQTGKPLRDKMTNGHKSKIVTGYLVEAVLYVPVSIGEDSIGILIATHRDKEKEFSPEDERMLCTIARFAAIAIRNSQKYEEVNLKLQKKVEELSSYNKILHALSKTNSLSGVYSMLREQIRERWDVDNIGLWLVNHSTQKLDPFPKPTFHKSYSFGEELIGDVASRGEPMLATDIRLFSEPTKSVEPTLQLLARSAACVPIIENNNVIGVLAAFSKKENEFDEEDIKSLQTFSLAVATALRNVSLFEQVDKQRATILAAVNMLPHPVMIVDQDEKIIVSNKAANTLLNEIHSSKNEMDGSRGSCLMPLISLINGLSESKWCTKEIKVGDKIYVATLEYASMVGTIILMQDVTDPVTGTCNRRHFQDLAEQAFQQAKRYVKPLAALIIGLEDFQQVIHDQGHAVGDRILKEMASQLRGFLRTPDILGRYQDDKFVVILPETSLHNAIVVAERIIKLAKKPGSTENYKLYSRLTIGAGMLDSTNDTSVDTLMERAHRAYVSSKKDKGYQIKIYEDTCDG